jgi:hypothetical protein
MRGKRQYIGIGCEIAASRGLWLVSRWREGIENVGDIL